MLSGYFVNPHPQEVSMTRNALALAAIVVTLALLAGCGWIGLGGPDKYELEYDLEEGDTAELIFTRSLVNEREVMGRTMSDTMEEETRALLEVTGVRDEMLDIDLEYLDRTRYVSGESYSSDIDFSELPGSRASFSLSSRGMVSAFEGFDALPEIELVPGQLYMNQEMYTNELEYIFTQLPEMPVKAGDTWTYSMEAHEPVAGGEINTSMDNTLTLVGETEWEGESCLMIEVVSDIGIEGTTSGGGMEFEVSMEGEGVDVIYFDHRRGMILGSEGASKVTGTASNENLGFSIPVSIEAESTLKVEM
jgi:hypothetical protein